jgi:hypothetical protein
MAVYDVSAAFIASPVLTRGWSNIFSIDDNENAHLIQICDEIFGEQNRVLQGVWIKRVSPANDAKYFSSDHEFVLIYARKKELWRPRKLPRNEKQLGNYRNPDDDPRGSWNSVTYTHLLQLLKNSYAILDRWMLEKVFGTTNCSLTTCFASCHLRSSAV